MMKNILILLLIAFPVFSFAQIKYEKSIEFDSQIGLTEPECVHYRFGVEMVNGLRFSPLFSCGIGIGFETGKYDYKRVFYHNSVDQIISAKNTSFLPVFFRAKLNLTKKQVSPFLALNVGYIADIGDTSLVNASCLLAEACIGIDIPLKEENRLYLLLGYTEHHFQTYVRSYGYEHNIENIQNNFTKMVCIRIGFSF